MSDMRSVPGSLVSSTHSTSTRTISSTDIAITSTNISTSTSTPTSTSTSTSTADTCTTAVVDEPLWPVELNDSQLAQHLIYQVPIIVIAGMNYNALQLQLEGLFSNPGIHLEQIMVFYHNKFEEANTLAKVFDVDSKSTNVKYAELTQKAVMMAWELFPHADYIIFLDEEVIPSADFLNFFRQCFEAMTTDKTLSGISAWNPYGFASTSSFTGIAYRADMFPGLGFLMKQTVYEKNMKKKMAECCSSRPWDGWAAAKDMEMIFPEVSRVTRGRYEGKATNVTRELFNERPRSNSGLDQHKISMTASLASSDNYDNYLKSLLRKAECINNAVAEQCLAINKSYTFSLSNKQSKSVYVVYYDSAKHNAVLHRLCLCFQLGPRAALTQHRSLLRFSVSGRTMLLVGSSSPFFRDKPSSVLPLTPAQLKI